MINNNTQVSHGNRVDFSKIRKASQGMRIPKMVIGGITHQNGDWYNTIFSSFREQMMAELAAAKTPEEKQAVVDKYNNQQTAYGKLRPQFTDLSSVNFNQDVKDYQDLINSGFSFVNNSGINNGVTTGRYHKVGTAKRIGKDLADKWESDGYWAGQTQDRTTLGYKGDWNEDSDEFNNWQKSLNDIGMETYLDEDNTYKLRLLQPQDPPLKNISTPPNTPPDEPSNPGDYTPDEYHNFQFKPEPFLTPNPFIAGLSLAANKHAYDNEMQKKVPLLEAPYHQYITGAYKATVDAYDKAGTDIQSAANRIANQSSNLEQNQAIQLEGAAKAADKRLEGALKQQEGYNFDRGKSLETAYFNSDADNRIANINRQNLVADWNRRMDAKSKYQWTRNNIKSDFINKTWTDFQQWAANEKNERDSALASYNNYVANLGIQNAMKPYTDLASDPMKSKSFNTVYQNAFNDFESNRGNNSWLASNKALEDIFTNDELDQKAKNDAFMNYLRTSNSDYTTQFNQGYNSELNEAKNKTIADRQSIQNELASVQPSFRNTYIGGLGPWDTRRLGKKLTLFSKNGGILKMRRGSRFVDYLEHNRKAIKDQKQTTIEVSKQMERQLKEQLQSLDRETLILLRSIFK